MPVYLSNTLIDHLFEQTDLYLNKAVTEWQMLAPEVFEAKPSAAQWSANQCLLHLNSYGNYYLPQIKKAITLASEANQRPATWFKAGWLGNYFTNMMIPKKDGAPAKKMSSPKDHSPLQNDDSAKVIATFIDQQEDILLLLDQARHIDLNKTRVPISIAKFIRLQLGDTFLFLIAHNNRHILQAERALTSAGVNEKRSEVFSLEAILS